MIISGKLPCSKDESATLAALNLRIFEINLIKMSDNVKSPSEHQNQNLPQENVQNEDISRVSYSNYPNNTNNNNNDDNKNIIEEEEEADLAPKEAVDAKKSSLLTSVSVPLAERIATTDVPILKKNGLQNLLLCFKSCASASNQTKFMTLNQLVAPCYHRSSDIIKLIKAKKAKLANASYFSDEMRLKEYYVKLCRNLTCFGCVLFQVKEIIFSSEERPPTSLMTFKIAKRLLAIKPNKISLIDYKTKQLVKTERMADLKSWFSGDGYYNLTPVFLSNPASTALVSIDDPAFNFHTKLKQNIVHKLLRIGPNSLDMNKLFVIEFRSVKWHMQIDHFHSLKSITCILLDQSLDMGIDNNPLMLDLTISEHNSRHKLYECKNSARNASHRYNSSSATAFYSKKRHTHSSARMHAANSAVSNNSSNQSKNVSNRTEAAASPSVSIIAQRNHSLVNLDQDQNSDFLVGFPINGSFSLFGDRPLRRNNPIASIFSKSSYSYGYGTTSNFYGSARPCFKYEKEFQELQMLLLWFPEEVAVRLTQIEYELFRTIAPAEYLRHATLDMNNFKSGDTTNIDKDCKQPLHASKVQDLIVRYKEVSSWIKRLIQSQTTIDKRIAIILSIIRCAITCWNIGNFNSARELWLGIKTALVNQNEDFPGMEFLNGAFDSSTFIKTSNFMHSLPMSPNQAPSSNKPYSAHSINAGTNQLGNKQSSSIVIGIGNLMSGSNNALANMNLNSSNAQNNLISSCNNLLSTAKSSISTNHHGANSSVSSKTAEGRSLWLRHLAAIAANASSKRAYCSKTQIYSEAVSKALDFQTCKVVPFFGAFLHDLRFILESVPSLSITCNEKVQKPIQMVSELNGHENYFTRISVAGLLNTRKLKLAHELLQDINMFHMHPNTMPDSLVESKHLVESAVANMQLNDRKYTARLKNKSKSLDNLLVDKKTAVKRNKSEILLCNTFLDENKQEMEANVSDYQSFVLYASRRPIISYKPIRDLQNLGAQQNDTNYKHSVSFITLDDNFKLDFHILQMLHNGFTFCCIFNEWDMSQSNYLLNIRLESDNSTLIWSRPAWDVIGANPIVESNDKQMNSNLNNGSATNNNNVRRKSQFLDQPNGFQSKSENYLRKKLLTPSFQQTISKHTLKKANR
ncbi:1-phosphatidylinositol 4-5-bisphosphate phosphodiesterase epsilon-1 [Brachionus plicatilis]|uniref:1-phosphatidylinositol 4-5-bisphosphate phosphodiesterase epsilon-1 n=1 Tax=Brachionus plicatilis TaxID=10195 RepID=A0A3M7SYH6_BRAPC|nr:1-phosphatidylinositol 4-5-bisphosphate phosphodiesterase epsilon-1 [Brachionus plicatilis]